MQWFIGCSGFYYREWKPGFYPEKLPQREWLAFFSRQFNSLELNSSFYRFPQPGALKKMYDAAGDDFRFSVKAPRLITHHKQFNDTGSLLSDFYDVIQEGFREKLGAILFQLPGKTAYDEALLKRITGSLDRSFTNVVEFRHASWWKPEVFQQLADHNIVFCSISYPGLSDELIVQNSVVYYCYHGVPKLYYSRYPERVMEQLAGRIRGNKKIKTAYIYFNNTAALAAIHNARQCIKAIDKKDG